MKCVNKCHDKDPKYFENTDERQLYSIEQIRKIFRGRYFSWMHMNRVSVIR